MTAGEKDTVRQLREQGYGYKTISNIMGIHCETIKSHLKRHSTLFDGVVYIPDMSGSRDTCVFEAGEEAGIYLAELDVDQMRDYRKREVWGMKNRRPELYGIISSQE